MSSLHPLIREKEMIDIPREVKRINEQLINHYGIETSTGQAMWQVSWSDDQYEHRMIDTTPEGFILARPEVKYVPKYEWIEHKYVLERLVVVPIIQERELPASKLSYEPLYVFEDKHGNALPPNFEASKFIIDTIYASQGKKSMREYVTIEGDPVERLKQLEDALFGNESEITDALHHGDGITVPTNYKKEN